jgi:ribosomal protein L37AE/L43A
MENEIKQRKISRNQFYWVCPKCEQEIKGNGKKTLEHLKRLHQKLYCKTLKVEED